MGFDVRKNSFEPSQYARFLRRLRLQLVALPVLGITFRILKRIVDYLIWRIRVTFRYVGHPFKGSRTVWVDPDDIVYCAASEFNPIRCDGLVCGGDWDLESKQFCDLDVFHAFEDHFNYGVPWTGTEFFLNTVAAINRGVYYWNCKCKDDFLERCNKLDKLYYDIKKNGYKSQRELRKGFLGVLVINEISVNVDRNGKLLFNNGAHRLAISKLLGLTMIPVRLTVWHKGCQRPSFDYERAI